MKKLLTKTLFISLFWSAATPSGVQAAEIEIAAATEETVKVATAGLLFSAKKSFVKKNLVKTCSNSTFDILVRIAKKIKPITDILAPQEVDQIRESGFFEKLVKNPEKIARNAWNNKWNCTTFCIGGILGITICTAIHEWGHKTVLNYFYPNSAKIVTILPWGGKINFNDKNINSHGKNNPLEIADRLKIVAGIAAGPIFGFLASYILRKLSKSYTTNHTNSPFLSGLKLSFWFSSLFNIGQLVIINPDWDGPKIWQVLKHGYIFNRKE